MPTPTIASSSNASSVPSNNPTLLLRQRKRILYGWFFLLFVLASILIVLAYASKRATNDDPWDMYVHIVRTLFLELLVIVVFGYIYLRLTSSFRSSKSLPTTNEHLTDEHNEHLTDEHTPPPPKSTTPTQRTKHIWHKLLIISLIILFIPTFIVVIYPYGRWLPASVLHTLVDLESPLFVKVGFGTGVIMIEAFVVLFVIDILYHIVKRIEKTWLDNCFRKDSILSSPNNGLSTNTTFDPKNSSTSVDPEIAIQTNPAELEKWEKEQSTLSLTNTDGSIIVPRWVSIPFGLWKWLKIYFTPHPLPLPLAQLTVIITIAFTIWGFISGSSPPRIMHVEIPLLRLPSSLDGFRIALLTDVHVGPVVGYTKFASAVEIANSLSPDITVFTGDLTDATDEIVYPMLAPAAMLRNKYNRTYLVTGNHDYYEGSFVTKLHILESLGITVLTNRIVQVPENATETFDLVGVPDWAESRKPGPWIGTDLPGTVTNRNVSREMVVLAHQPYHAVESGLAAAGLQLSGHVHCGQLIPINVGAYVVMPYVKGLYERFISTSASSTVKNTLQATNSKHNINQDEWRTFIYMSCGTYGFGPLFRQGAPHEVTEVILRSVDVVGTNFVPIVEPR